VTTIAPTVSAQHEPFVQIPNWIEFHIDLTHADVRVWAALKHFWNRRTGQCNPSHQTISNLCRVSTSQIRNKSIPKLVEVGALVVKPDLKGGQRSHHYELRWTPPTASHSETSGPDRASLRDAGASLSDYPGASLSDYEQEQPEKETRARHTAADRARSKLAGGWHVWRPGKDGDCRVCHRPFSDHDQGTLDTSQDTGEATR